MGCSCKSNRRSRPGSCAARERARFPSKIGSPRKARCNLSPTRCQASGQTSCAGLPSPDGCLSPRRGRKTSCPRNGCGKSCEKNQIDRLNQRACHDCKGPKLVFFQVKFWMSSAISLPPLQTTPIKRSPLNLSKRKTSGIDSIIYWRKASQPTPSNSFLTLLFSTSLVAQADISLTDHSCASAQPRYQANDFPSCEPLPSVPALNP